MHRSRLVLALLLASAPLLLPRSAAAADRPPVVALAPEAVPATEPAAAATVAPVLPAHRMSPMVAELFAALGEQRAKLAQLRADLAEARDEARALELQRALSAAKQETELRLLGIQADHARREGRNEVAARLEDAMRAMRSPVPAPAAAAAPRPAPVRDSGR